MLTVKGKYNEAVVYVKELDEKCEEQIRDYVDLPVFAGTKVRVMPDVHLGKGSVIGFTATYNGYVAPNIIGVDIGCGVSAYRLGAGDTNFMALDKYIRRYVPAGRSVHNNLHPMLEAVVYSLGGGMSFSSFSDRLTSLAAKLGIPPDRFFRSLGTLGGGNHFIEIDKDQYDERWLLIHSGSRNPGLQVASYHHKLADKATPMESPIKYLSGGSAESYIEDMKFAQLYAVINRALMATTILDFFKLDLNRVDIVESVHNYMDFDSGIIRKGAISARSGEAVVIPFSMADGAVVGTGKGNAGWNYSAPHGSGRKYSRTKAQGLSMDDYRRQMRHVWSSSVKRATLDESPMAYKAADEIIDMLDDTVSVERRLFPIYNFKASE